MYAEAAIGVPRGLEMGVNNKDPRKEDTRSVMPQRSQVRPTTTLANDGDGSDGGEDIAEEGGEQKWNRQKSTSGWQCSIRMGENLHRQLLPPLRRGYHQEDLIGQHHQRRYCLRRHRHCRHQCHHDRCLNQQRCLRGPLFDIRRHLQLKKCSWLWVVRQAQAQAQVVPLLRPSLLCARKVHQ